jgi:hypothetical protein
MGVYLISVHLMDVYLISICLMSMYLVSVYLIGVSLQARLSMRPTQNHNPTHHQRIAVSRHSSHY